jgi:type I restriction enzyme S subunit
MVSKKEQVRLGDVARIDSMLVDPREPQFRDMLHIGGANIESSTGRLIEMQTAAEENLISGKYLFDQSMVLYSKIRPYLMKVAFPKFSGLCSADIYPLSVDRARLDADYLFFLLLSYQFTQYAIVGSNRAGMPKVNRGHLFSYEFQLPHLDEQRRVVCRIKECMELVDEIKGLRSEATSEVQALYPSRCHDFFKETALPESWKTKTVGDIAHSIQYGYTQSASKSTVGPRFLRITDIQNRGVDWDSVPYCEADSKTVAKYKLCQGDILFARTGATTGKSFLLKESPPISVFASYLIRLAIDGNRALPQFVFHFFQSPTYWDQVRRSMRGGAQPNVNATMLRSLSIPIPNSLDEQREVVGILDEAFHASTSLAANQNEQTQSIGLLRASILRRAFAGEL